MKIFIIKNKGRNPNLSKRRPQIGLDIPLTIEKNIPKFVRNSGSCLPPTKIR